LDDEGRDAYQGLEAEEEEEGVVEQGSWRWMAGNDGNRNDGNEEDADGDEQREE
jgi:hypothetical protein